MGGWVGGWSISAYRPLVPLVSYGDHAGLPGHPVAEVKFGRKFEGVRL